MKLRALRSLVHDDLVPRGQIFDVTKADGQRLVGRGLAEEVVAAADVDVAAPRRRKGAAASGAEQD